MEEKRIKVIKTWPKPQLVRDIQVFLGFANFYRKFIKNFSRIAAPLTSMLQTTGNNNLDIQADQNEKNQDALNNAGGTSDAGGGGSIKNLATAAKSVKSKKPKLTKTKKSDFARANYSEMDFFISEAKKTFIYLWKAFSEALILRHFDPERHIRIETNTLRYAISGVLSQMISDHLDQLSSDYVTHKNLDPISSKSEIGQWHSIAFFSQKMIPAETWYETHN